jgi:hypothetical protein
MRFPEFLDTLLFFRPRFFITTPKQIADTEMEIHL